MAQRFALFAALFLAPILILLTGAGCQDDQAADAQLPPPSFNSQTLPPPASQPPQYTAAAPVQPPPAQTTQRPRPGPYHRYSYADSIPADWIIHGPARQWQWIIIHHTATTFGNAAIVTRWHIDRGFDEMGYHFLIGNGTNSGDGQVEVGTRWPKQKWGAHTKSPDNRFNNYGIGICLVGNFDIQYPSAAQMRSLDKLVAYLMKTYHIPPERVLGHDDCKSTDCPGKHLSVALVRRGALAILASEGETFPPPVRHDPSEELIRDASAR
jgi:hypothetical protein